MANSTGFFAGEIKIWIAREMTGGSPTFAQNFV